jgi:Zn-dependent protease with chaperone function
VFGNFLYFIVVLLIYSTFQPGESTNFSPLETALLFVALTGLFAWITYRQFQSIGATDEPESFSQADARFNAALTRQCVMAVGLFAVDIYGLNLASFFADRIVFKTAPTLLALFFIGLFAAYLAMVWGVAYDAYQRLYHGQMTRKSYIGSQIAFSVPILLPWLVLSGVSDLIQALPFEAPKAFLDTTAGELSFFLFFLLLVVVVGPALIQWMWRCRPLEPGLDRARIEALCQKAGMTFQNILHWPIFGGRMLTAAVMGLVRRFRYILVTDALLGLLTPAEIEAVIAHEIGHVKKKHLLFYLFFFVGYLLISYALFDIIIYVILYSKPLYLFINRTGLKQTTVTSVVFSLGIIFFFLVYFRYIFGYFMRNFERQADLYVYELFDSAVPLITTLRKIAITSGQSPDRPNWHHFSITERIGYLMRCEANRSWIAKHHGKVRKSIVVYLIGMLAVAGIGYQLNYGEGGKKLSRHFLETVITRELERLPNNANLYSILGDLYYSEAKFAKTARAYETAISLDPNLAQVLNNLAWLYATCQDPSLRNPARALVLAQAAAKLTPLAHVLDTLAESFFVNGRIPEAVAAETRALAAAASNRQYYRKQLEKFKQMEN